MKTWYGQFKKKRSLVSESVDMGKENLFKPMIKNIQMRFRDLLNEIDSKHFQETLVQCDILSTEFFHSLKNLPRRKRAEMLIINLFMCPEDWVPVFMKILQEKYKILYQSITGIDARIGIANDDSWCNQCTRKIIKYIIKDSMDNAKIPLDAGKLVQVLFEEQVIMPRQYEEVIVQDCLSKRTETLLNILDNDYTDSRCLGAFKKAINEAGYENCCNVLEDVMSNWRDCNQCNGHFTDDVKKKKQMFGKLREQRLSGYNVSSTLTQSENSEKNEKTIVYKFEVNSRSEEEHDEILEEFIAKKNSLDNCIKGLGEVVSITKGCIAIVVKCNQTDSSYGDVAIKMLESMLSGNLPWNVLDNGNIKVQICVTELSEGEDTELMHDKISLLHHVPVILEEMDALDFEHAFAESGLIDTEDFWRMFDIENIGRQERMLKLLRFILKNDQRIFFDCFINVLRDSFDTPLEHLKNSFSQIEGKTFDRNTKQNTYSDIDCIKGVQTEHNERVDDNCYKRFAASSRQYITIKNRLVYLAVFLLILLFAFCMTIPFKSDDSGNMLMIGLIVGIVFCVLGIATICLFLFWRFKMYPNRKIRSKEYLKYEFEEEFLEQYEAPVTEKQAEVLVKYLGTSHFVEEKLWRFSFSSLREKSILADNPLAPISTSIPKNSKGIQGLGGPKSKHRQRGSKKVPPVETTNRYHH